MIAVLMSTYNGERYIDEQISSILCQSIKEFKLYIRDDGSTDGTRRKLKVWENNFPKKIFVSYGKNIGFVKSFLSLLYHVESADYYAFADQDDIWFSNKLEIALNNLKDHILKPSIYTSNVFFCDANCNIISKSNYNNNGTIWRALLYNQAVGCTLVINNPARDIVLSQRFEEINFENVFAHDAWIFRICIGVDAYNYFDNNAYIYYRLHGKNAIGSGFNFLGVWKRRLVSFIENYHIKQKISKELYSCYYDALTNESKKAAEEIGNYDKHMLDVLFNRKIYTNNMMMNAALFLAILCKRV